jgi:cyclase
MIATRVIPTLLLRNRGLVKTVRFGNPRYVGDPINAVRIFNDKEVDELAFLDITATVEGREPPYEALQDIASECFMPFCYGGGVTVLDQIRRLLKLGVEKVALNSEAVRNPEFIRTAADQVGSQSIVVSIDVKRNLFGQYRVQTHSGKKGTGLDPVRWAARAEELGAGEILLNSIDRDGTMQGYDLDLVARVSSAVNIPVIACGGAGDVNDLAAAVKQGGASAAAAGSMFVFEGKHRAVLISYPPQAQLRQLFSP